MGFIEMVHMIYKQIQKHVLESILLILAIALGVSVIGGVVGLMEGYDRQIDEQINQPGFRVFEMSVKADLKGNSGSSSTRTKLTYEDYLKLKDSGIPGVEHIWLSSTANGQSKDARSQIGLSDKGNSNSNEVIYVTPGFFDIVDFEIEKGDIFTELDVKKQNRVVVVGKELVDTGPGLQLGTRYQDLKVIGVVSPRKNEDIDYIKGIGYLDRLSRQAIAPYFSKRPEKAIEDIYLNKIYIMAAEGAELQAVHSRLKNYINENYTEEVTVSGNFMRQEQIKNSNRTIGKTVGFFAIAGLFIAAINILNLMLTKVLRRRKNIGISVAMGATKLDIFKLFLIESMVLGLVGGIIGLGLTFGGLKLLGSLIQMKLNITLITLIASIAVSILVGAAFGVYPAYQATQVNAIDVLKEE